MLPTAIAHLYLGSGQTEAARHWLERGKLDLDAPAAKVVSELTQIQVLEGFDSPGNR